MKGGIILHSTKQVTYLSPIWPILKVAMSASLLESPPFGALDMVMVFGSTVLGSWGKSCTDTHTLDHSKSLKVEPESYSHHGQDRQRWSWDRPSSEPCHPARAVAAAWRASCSADELGGIWWVAGFEGLRENGRDREAFLKEIYREGQRQRSK